MAHSSQVISDNVSSFVEMSHMAKLQMIFIEHYMKLYIFQTDCIASIQLLSAYYDANVVKRGKIGNKKGFCVNISYCWDLLPWSCKLVCRKKIILLDLILGSKANTLLSCHKVLAENNTQ